MISSALSKKLFLIFTRSYFGGGLVKLELISSDRRLTRQEQWQKGKALIDKIPWEVHANWELSKGQADPIKLLQENDKGRLAFLLPIRYSRMAASTFAFLRGSAVIMAADLAKTPVSGIETMLCGDAHLSNFGIFATPERKLIFDVNDFDECYPGPWEWDLKRLAASAVVAGRENGFADVDNRGFAQLISKCYRESMDEFASMPTLNVWYYTVEADSLLELFSESKRDAKIIAKAVKKARTKTQEQSLEKLTQVANGKRQFINNPPLMIRLDDLLNSNALSESEKVQVTEEDIQKAWLEYVSSVSVDRQELLSRYHIVDIAMRVVGVGSVGTRCLISLLEGNAPDDAIILQLKEAGVSALEKYLPKRGVFSKGRRVVTGQRLMQSASDIFLGWSSGPTSPERQYYFRQLKDMKVSIDLSVLNEKGFAGYVSSCSRCLAHAHARAGYPAEISGYLDGGFLFDAAIADFAIAYADQTEQYHKKLLDEAAAGLIHTQVGI